MFKFHVSVKTEGAVAVGCSDLLGVAYNIYFRLVPNPIRHGIYRKSGGDNSHFHLEASRSA